MRILVTGGAGFIGSHLCAELINEGHEVTALDLLSTGQISNLTSVLSAPNFEFIQGSILDLDVLQSLVKKSDYIFHLAAAVGVFNIIDKPLDSLLINIRGTENILEAAALHRKPVFLTSSSEVYGKNVSNSLSEDDDRILGSPLTLRWAYSEAKAIDESLAYAYYVEKQLEIRIVMFFNTVGPRQLGNYGMVLPRFVRAALNGDPIRIYGSGEQTRCFAHVNDVVEAVIALAFNEKAVGKVVNVGNNNEISINRLADEVIKITNSKSKIVYVPYDEAYGTGFEDMSRRVPNIDLIKELVGWSPSRNLKTIITDISDEMKSTY